MNPNILREEWDWRVVRTILTRRVSEYENNPKFDEYYDDIVKLIKSADYVFGHSLNGDAKALNCDCLRYGLPSIDFKFYDIKEFYKQYNSTNRDISVGNILNDLQIENWFYYLDNKLIIVKGFMQRFKITKNGYIHTNKRTMEKI